MRYVYLLIVLLSLQSCASLPDKRVLNVMTHEERQKAYKEAQDSRLFWQCTAAAAGVLGGVAVNGDNASKISTAIILPLVLIPAVSIANYQTYPENDPEIRSMTDFALYGGSVAAALGGIAYISSETGPVAGRGSVNISIIPVFALEGAVLSSAIGMIWHHMYALFGWNRGEGELK